MSFRHKTIKVPKKFKFALESRLDYKMAQLMRDTKDGKQKYMIIMPCPLCTIGSDNRTRWECRDCPFVLSRTRRCKEFIRSLLNDQIEHEVDILVSALDCIAAVVWEIEDDEVMRRLLPLLVERAKECIQWVDDEEETN